MSLSILIFVHVLISLLALAAGFLFWAGLREGSPRSEMLFLTTTAATSLTGYLFPYTGLLPSHIVGALSLLLLAVAWKTRPARGRAYIISSMSAFYLNLLVLIAQLFKRIPEVKSMEPIAQLILLLAFISATVSLVRRDSLRASRSAA